MKIADYLRESPQTPINRLIKKLEDSRNRYCRVTVRKSDLKRIKRRKSLRYWTWRDR